MSVPLPFDNLRTPIAAGTTLIEASAGTGKTHAITHLVVRLLLEGQVSDVTKLLVVTYTNAATAELAGRVRAALAQAALACSGAVVADHDLQELGRIHGASGVRILREALLHCDELSVSTIHGFCKRVLETAAFESGMPFNAEFTTDDTPLVDLAARDVWRTRMYGDTELAALAVAREWGVEQLTAAHHIWRRHEAALILPAVQPLNEARTALRQALDGLLDVWDATALETLLDGLVWNKGPLQSETVPAALRNIAALGTALQAQGLEAIAWFTSDALVAAINKTKCKARALALATNPIFAACTLVQRCLVTLDHAWRVEALRELDARFRKAKQDSRVLAFDDLLQRLRDALRDPQRGAALRATVRARYQAALIDEFQDTDPVQSEIFTTLFADSNLVLVGDPKQAIYAFRGADLDTYLAVAKRADRHFQLDTNWRSSAALVAAVNALFSVPQRPFLAKDIAFHPVKSAGRADAAPLRGDGGVALHWWLVGEGAKLSKEKADDFLLPHLAGEAARLLGSGATIGGAPLAPRDLAVLVRTNTQAIAVQAALAAVGIPAVVSGSGDVLASAEAGELTGILAAIADPGDAARLRGALASTLWGWDAGEINALNGDDRLWQALSERLERWRQRWQRNGLGALIEHLLDGEGWSTRLLASEGGERRLTNLRHLRELLQAAEAEHHLAPAGLLAWLADARAHQRLDSERVELRLESDADAVRVLTMHKAKGLEFPVVFCPYLWEAAGARGEPVATRFAGERVVAWPGADAALAQADTDALGESLRLAYVALTRAVHRCYVVWADTKDSHRSPLAYLIAQPPGVADGDDLTWAASVRDHAASADRQAAIRALVAAHSPLMAIEVVAGALPPARLHAPARSAGRPRQLALAPDQLDGWRISSFTGLSAGVETALRDHADPSEPRLGATAGLHAFAAGTRAGTCLHHWLEHLDWQQPVQRGPLNAALARFDLVDPVRHGAGVDAVSTWLGAGEKLRTLAIPGLGAALASIPRERRHAEWSFHVPLARLRPRDLQGIFANQGSERSRRDYAPRLAGLDDRTVRGFLAGFVDLVVEHAGRWWVIDWKSNRLGEDGSAYHEGSLWQAMVDHHYVLQQHLYLLALHRHLRARLGDYDPRRHLGGAIYVFLRGLDGGQPWFCEPADVELIEALDAALVEPALVEGP